MYRVPMDTDFLFGQRHQILVDALQAEVYICPCHGNAAGQGFFIGLGVDVVLFQEHQPVLPPLRRAALRQIRSGCI